MLLVASALLFCTVLPSTLQFPLGGWGDPALGYDLTADYLYDGGYYGGGGGPWNPDYLRWGGGPYDYQHYHGPADYYYYGGGPPRAVDFSKENYVRDYPYGGTEVGMRDSVTVRKGSGPPPYPGRYFGAPAPYLMSPHYPSGRFASPDDLFLDPVSPYYKRLQASGLAAPRPSSLRTGGDFTFLRR